MDAQHERKTIEIRAGGFSPDALNGILAREAENITIVAGEGEYYLEKPILFGKGCRRITLRAEGNVRFIGGKRLTGIQKVTDREVLERLDASVGNRVLQCSLADNGLPETAGLASRGFARKITPSHAELFVDTAPYHLTQYPKRGEFMLITGYGKEEVNEWGEKVGTLEHGFEYDSERPRAWKPGRDVWVHGYWSWDWANSYEKVTELDAERMTVKTAPPYGNYAFKTGQRFYFLNILEELTEPGDYYIDRDTNMLYFCPADDSRCEEVILSVMDEPLVAVDAAEDIRIEGVTFEAVRGHALRVSDSRRVAVDRCAFRNIGNCAVVMKDCADSSVSGCTIHDTGDGGVSVASGGHKTLAPANVSVHNNHFHHIAKWTRCYQPPIGIYGAGISATHNLIHDCPHTAILYGGNEITIEGNEIYSAVMETGDAGAIYAGRDYTCRGNRVCGNFIHHLGGVGMGTMGIYNDDCLSGTVMEGNFFYEVSRAVFLGGGRDFAVKNNVFVDCRPAVEMDGRGASGHPVWRNMVDNMMKKSFYETVAENPLYMRKYPELADIDSFYRQGKPIPPSARIENNIFCSERTIEPHEDAEKGEFLLRSNCKCGREDFVDAGFGDFTLREGSPALEYGYTITDIRRIGLIEEERCQNPLRIYSNLRLDQDEGRLFLSLKNLGGQTARVEMTLHTDRPLESVTGRKIGMEIGPYEKKNVAIDLPSIDGSIRIEARGDTPGVRPCGAAG